MRCMSVFCAVVGMAAALAAPCAAESRAESARKWVQEFYTWYAKKCEGGFGVSEAIKARPAAFSPGMKRGIAEDEAESAKHKDEIVGLDFDPILDAQDFAQKYVTGKVTQKKDRYLVQVYGVWNGKKNAQPDVTPEVRWVGGHWRFEEFHYRRDANKPEATLSSTLKELRDERKKSGGKSGK